MSAGAQLERPTSTEAMSQDSLRELRLVDVVELHSKTAGGVAWSSAPAREAAGLDAFASIHYRSLRNLAAEGEGEVAPQDAPVLVGVAGRVPVDGRGDPHARSIHPEERRVTFAAEDLEDALGISEADVETNGPRVAIFAAEGVVAFQLAADVATVELDEDLVESVRP